MPDERRADCYKMMPIAGGDHAARIGAVAHATARLGFTDCEVVHVTPLGPWVMVTVRGTPPPREGTLADNLTESRMPRKRRVRRKR